MGSSGILIKGNETLTSKERVRKVFEHENPDRVPVNFNGNAVITGKMMKYFGAKNDEELLAALGVDFRNVGLPYTGRPLFEDNLPGRKINPLSGVHTKWIEHANGGYWDYCDFPLKDAELPEVENWPFPDPDSFDYEAALAYCKENSDMALYDRSK